MFATDRDLLALEPNLFRDVGWISQRLVIGTGSVAGATLTLSAQDVTLAQAHIEPGHIVLMDGAPYEVLARPSDTTLTISRLRDDPEGDPLAPSPATGKPVVIYTFRPQIALIHAQILRMLGLEPAASDVAGVPTESNITNPAALRHLECLGALYLIYTAATAPDATWRTSHEFNRAQIYRDRFAAERHRTAAALDLDGDGRPDATRRLNLIQFVRS
jgi:hypothetical protein